MEMTNKQKAHKHWNNMTRCEKRAYKRWLRKYDLWDGAEVIERLQKVRLLTIDQ